MNTVVEIECAIDELPLPEMREVFDFLTERLEAEAGEVAFPDLKALLIEFPGVGADADFARVREMARDLDLS